VTGSSYTPAVTEASEVPLEDPRPDDLRRVPSVVVLNTGDGKGKSSAAFGVMIRAVARGWPVAVVQFVKSGKWHVGEETIGRQLGVDWFNVGDGFTWDSADLEHDKALARAGWQTAAEIIAAGAHRLVVLDEITYLCTWAWIDTEAVTEAIRSRPDNVSIVLTGRDAPAGLVEVADTVTEMRKVKHAYDAGITALRGIEY
jgi:cob(I)alamin adenosyltransferase